MILPRSFYNQPTLKAAQELLGCFLVVLPNGKSCITNAVHANVYQRKNRYKIVETEAYVGHKDKASHARRGKTKRNQIMFGPPGVIYVYFTYGMHYMFNIVTERKDYPAAVLIRAVEPIDTTTNLMTNGPAKLTKALKIDKKFNSLPIYKKDHGLWIENKKQALGPGQIVRTTRVGIDYAEEYREKRWRYYLEDNKFVSKF
ncbi:DNA-3-methyladenine glycosylase [Patescibacteria group bacterium]